MAAQLTSSIRSPKCHIRLVSKRPCFNITGVTAKILSVFTPMANCVYCGVESELFVNGVPICISCDQKPPHERPMPKPKENLEPPPKTNARAVV
jgi:hypothetical protein